MTTNTLLTISMVTNEAARVLQNNLGFTRCCNRTYSDYFARNSGKIGSSLKIRKPTRYVVTDGATLTIQDTTDDFIDVTLAQKHIGAAFTSAERTLSLEDYTTQVLNPAMAALANKIDYVGLQVGLTMANLVGTPGSPPATADAVLAAQERLDNLACPDDGMRSFIMTPAANRKIVGGLSTLFNDTSDISRQYKTGRMKNGLGFDFVLDQNCPTVTVGTGPGGTPVVNTSSGITSGSANITMTGGSGSVTNAYKAGEVITIAGVYAVNPQNRVSTGQLMNFVLTAAVDTSSGNATLVVSPTPVTTEGVATQNCSISGAGASKAVTQLSGTTAAATYKNSIAMHRDAVVFCSADLNLPANVSAKRIVRDGVSIRALEAYDSINDREIIRFDVLFGFALAWQELGVRVTD